MSCVSNKVTEELWLVADRDPNLDGNNCDDSDTVSVVTSDKFLTVTVDKLVAEYHLWSQCQENTCYVLVAATTKWRLCIHK